MPETSELVRDADEAQLGAVYRAAFADVPGGPNADFTRGQPTTHRQREGFRLVGAVQDDALLGFAYGYTGQRL